MSDANTLAVQYLIEDHKRLAQGGQWRDQLQHMVELADHYRKEAATLRADLMEAQNSVGELTRNVSVEKEHRHTAEKRVTELTKAVDELKKTRTPNQQVADKTRTLETKLANAVRERDEARRNAPVSSAERATLTRLISTAIDKFGDDDVDGAIQTLNRATATLNQHQQGVAA